MASTSVFSSNLSHRAYWLVYMNGIEVPCPSLNISYGVWEIPQCNLQMAPHYTLERLGAEDKVDVVVFYLDDFQDPNEPKFCLAFEGEIVGWSYQNSSNGRMMSFDCVANIATYQQLYYFFLNTAEAVYDKATNQSVDGVSVTQPGAVYPYSLFKQGLLSESADPPPDINGPYDILDNIIRGMVGSTLPTNRRAIPSINFFSRWVRKNNLMNRFTALPFFEDKTLAAAGQDPGIFAIIKAARDVEANRTQQTSLSESVGNAGSLLDVIKKIFGTVFYELAMIPSPAAVRAQIKGGAIIGPALADPTGPAHLSPVRLQNYYAKPQMLFAIPPTCNVFFRSMVNSHNYQENFATQPTRIYVNDSFYTALPNMGAPYNAYATTAAYPPEVSTVLKRKFPNHLKSDDQAAAVDPSQTGRNVLVWPEEFFKGPVTDRRPIPAWYTHLLNTTRSAADRESLQDLFELYAQYEYVRARYEKRGGSVSMHHNPYALPGYPCVVFDTETPALHMVGYVMHINHSFSSNGRGSMSTQVNYSFGRTLREMLDEVKAESFRLGGVLGAAPADPVDDTRLITQDFTVAEQFYNATLHQRAPMKGSKKASFDFREVIGYATPVSKEHPDGVERIYINGPTQYDVNRRFVISKADEAAAAASESTTEEAEAQAEAQAQAAQTAAAAQAASATATTPVTTNIDPSREFVPTAGFQGAFQSFDAAMNYVARPICSISEYLEFLYPDQSLDELLAAKTVEGGTRIEGTSAIYFSRIKRFRPTVVNPLDPNFERPAQPGFTARPTPSQAGAVLEPLADNETTPDATTYTGAPAAVPADFPQTRQDWDTVLLKYREEIRRIYPQR